MNLLKIVLVLEWGCVKKIDVASLILVGIRIQLLESPNINKDKGFLSLEGHSGKNYSSQAIDIITIKLLYAFCFYF